MRRTHIALSVAFALALGSCQSGSVPVGHEDHRFEDGEDVDLGTQPWRARRRMDVDQLDRSIRDVTGDIGWDFARYADTLGVPDYQNSSSEDLSVSLLFQKFLDDAARDVCQDLAAREAGETPQGTFAPVSVSEPSAPAETREALANLLLRFHGRHLAPDDVQLDPWVDLHGRLDAAITEAEAPPQRVWEGVCVALITHPDFYTY